MTTTQDTQAQIKSKERVAERGEVFTAEREVNAMLDLVKQETERIDSRFLEPACGNGNFLIKILERKLNRVEQLHKASRRQWEQYAMVAVCSIYGIELMEDNLAECRERLYQYVLERSNSLPFSGQAGTEWLQSVRFVLERNICWGNALTMQEPVPDDATPQEKLDAPHIVFSEWGFTLNGMVKRHDYIFRELIPENKPAKDDLFAEPHETLVSDQGQEAFIPESCQQFTPIKYYKLYTQADGNTNKL